MSKKIIGACLEFAAKTMNTVALAFLLVGVVNPYIELNRDGDATDNWLLMEEGKLEALGMTLKVGNPGVNINWLLTSLVVYVLALAAVAFAKSLEDE